MNIILLLYMDNTNININNVDKNYTKKITKIQNLYDNLTYYDSYGGSLLIFIILTCLLFMVVSYCYIKLHISFIKKNWVTDRCKPYVIPFAGIINKPSNMTAEEYTEQNFTYCAQTILKDISGFMIEPLTFILAGLEAAALVFTNDLQGVRASFNNSRNHMSNIVGDIFSKFMNLMMPLQVIIVKFGDVVAKVQGTLQAGIYTLVGGTMTFQVLLDVMLKNIALILIYLSPLFLVPFVGEIILPFYIMLMVPFLITLSIFQNDLGASIDWNMPPPAPSPPPACFDKNTVLKMSDGSEKKIIDANVGDVLANNNMITAKIKLTAEKIDMYTLNDIIVSGTHSVKIKDTWVKIADCKIYNCSKIENYNEEYIYCLNTESKKIKINEFIFCDWDEIFEDDIETIKIAHKTNKYKTNNENKKEFDNSYIHKFFDGGFVEDTKITMFDGTEKDIKDVNPNDILKNREKVYGIVEIEGKNINQYIYNLGKLNSQIVGGSNLNLCDKTVKFTTTIHLDEKQNQKQKIDICQDKLYHLLTDKKSFHVSNLRFYDYNASIELILDKYRGKLLSMKYV